MVPLCYRTATVNGLKNPAYILHASYCDVQDANEMRTVENAKRNERHTGRIRDDSDSKKNRHSEWVAVGVYLEIKEYYFFSFRILNNFFITTLPVV